MAGEKFWERVRGIGKGSPSPDRGSKAPAKEIYTGEPATPEVAAAKEVLKKLWEPGPITRISPEEYPLLVAAARSDQDLLRAMVSRMYRDEVRELREAMDPEELTKENEIDREHAIASAQVVTDAEQFGFALEEIKPVLDTLRP